MSANCVPRYGLVILILAHLSAAYFPLGTDPLSEQLSYYEIIQIDRTVEKEGSGGNSPANYNRQERLTFYAFRRSFVIYLTPKRGILHSNFHFVEVGENGSEQLQSINPDEHYEGHVYGSNDSAVSVTFDDHGAMLGIVRLRRNVYAFEPARLHKENSNLNDVLVYRNQDMKTDFAVNGPKTCLPVKPPKIHFPDEIPSTFFNRSAAGRNFWRNNRILHRRSVVNEEDIVQKNRCSLRVVADYAFYEVVGNKSTAFASRYIINVIDRINALYTVVDWGLDQYGKRLVNMGFMIKDMKIHTSITDKPGHYNRHKRGDFVNVNALLENFSHAEGSEEYCLVHLFTAHSFENGVLGLGHIASSEFGPPGGMCSFRTRNLDNTFFAYNTALSTVKTTQGGVVVSREADLVTAHELGHNWGATHDDLECTPSYVEGGAYLMNTFSVSGYDANNYKFSPCSKRMIGKVLGNKAAVCFEEEKSSFCGNGRIEKGTDGVVEECDVGGKLFGADKCCHDNCTLKEGMQCSPKNSPCCSEDCQFLTSDHACLHKNPFQCRDSSYCTGVSGDCPEPKPIADRTKCVDEGECRGGLCLSVCEQNEKEPCICPAVKDSCYRCCRPRDGLADNDCQPYERSPKFVLRNGTRCIHGYCEKGICKKEVADGVSILWFYLQQYDRTNFMKMVQDNVVGLIAIFMLLVWIPISIAFHRYDKLKAAMTKADNVELISESKSSSPLS